MHPFELDRLILFSLKADAKRMNFFRPIEPLMGKTISEFFLKDPNSISNALAILESAPEAYEDSNRRSFVQQLVESKPRDVQKRLKEVNFVENPVHLVRDFNFISQLERAYEVGAAKSAEILIEAVFRRSNVKDYQSILM